jgi:hypothetical protein
VLPLFFIPNVNAMSHDLIVEHGLDRIIGISYQSQQTFQGPGGVPGMLIASNDVPATRLRCTEAEQTWSKRYGFTSLVGTWNDALPTAEELRRETVLNGGDVQLLDGSSWHVPTLRAWRDGDNLLEYDIRLPRVLQQCADTGRWLVTKVVPQYAQLWDASINIAEKLLGQLRDQDSAALDYSDLFDFAVALLAVNYRVDASILSHLGVLQPDLAAQIARHALDWPTLETNLKNVLSRRLSGGTNTESGATPPTAA